LSKSLKYNLERVSDTNWIPINAKLITYSGKLPGIFAEKDRILLEVDPSKTKLVLYSAVKKISLVEGERISKAF